MVALFLVIAIALGALGQISLRKGMAENEKSYGSLGTPGIGMISKVVRAVFTPYVLLGLALYAVSSGFWLVVISPGGWALSYAYPMIAIGYVLVVLLSRAFFHERVMPLQWLGILVMCTGLVLVAHFGASRG
jgi:multidrug transporter EmrE-like cation transporter